MRIVQKDKEDFKLKQWSFCGNLAFLEGNCDATADLIPSRRLALPNTACWCLDILSIGSEGEILGEIIYGKSSICLQSKYCFQIAILFDSIFS